MGDRFNTSGQCQDILLVGIGSTERAHISSLLVHDGYKPQHLTYTWFREHEMVASPRLIIVDTRCHGNKVINTVRNKIVEDADNAIKNTPPILAIVDTCLKYKQEIFDYGATDYVSSPLIIAEFSNRVDHAIHAVDWPSNAQNAQADFLKDHSASLKTDDAWPINTDHVLAIKTANYLKSMIGQKISLIEVARNMATNRNKLSRAFKHYYGLTVFDWLRERRMMLAAEHLRSTIDTVQQIADKCGYPDSNNFSTAFKRTFHLSPLQYRKVQQTKNIVHRSKARQFVQE